MLALNLFVLGMHSRDKLSLKSQGSYITSASHTWHTALNVIILYAISLYDWMTRLQCRSCISFEGLLAMVMRYFRHRRFDILSCICGSSDCRFSPVSARYFTGPL